MRLLTCLALLTLAQDSDPRWALLRGPKQLPARTSFEAIAKMVLRGEGFEILEAENAEVAASKSRFIFGSVADNPAGCRFEIEEMGCWGHRESPGTW